MMKNCGFLLFGFGFLLVSSMSLYCGAVEPSMIVEIRDYSYQPASITVPAGATVTWINKDSTAHTVTPTDGSFNSGNIASGAWFNQTFNASGTYQYQCLIHASMVGEVIVTPNSTASVIEGSEPSKKMSR